MGDRHERPETATLTRTAFVSRAITPPSFPPTFGGVFFADFPLKTTTTGEEDEIKYDETKKTHQRPLHVKGVLLHQVLGICAEKNIRIERASQRYAREDARGGVTLRATTSRRRGTLNLSRVPTVSQQRKLKQTACAPAPRVEAHRQKDKNKKALPPATTPACASCAADTHREATCPAPPELTWEPPCEPPCLPDLTGGGLAGKNETTSCVPSTGPQRKKSCLGHTP